MKYDIWNTVINNKSIKVRFLTTLFVNILRIGIGFIIGVVIARTLNPAGYGNYSFLLGSFISILAILDMGTSQAFYTFISQKRHGPKFYIYYLLWILIQFILAILFIAFIFPDTWRDRIWLGHTKGMIILAFTASFMMDKIWQIVSHAGESIRATVSVQLYNISVVSLYLCAVLAMAFLHFLTIPNLFIATTFTYLLLSFILAIRLKDNLIIKEEARLPNIINEFKRYCSPLVIYSIVSFLYSFANVWLLQKFAGATQQGFYSIGLRFSAICLIATTSILKVFWKEIAEANEAGNKERLSYLYTKISRALCFVGAVGACFLIPFSKEMLLFLLGPKYERGSLSLAIMFLYPIHQSLGQINGSYFYATAQTKLYSKVNIIMMLFSIPVTYFVLASRSSMIPGLALGSVGLALKMVIFQIIGVNILTFFICKASRWRFDFLYQFGNIGVLLVVSFAIKGLVGWIFHASNISLPPLVLIAGCVPLYILAIGLVIYLYPGLSGLERREIRSAIRFLRTGIKKA